MSRDIMVLSSGICDVIMASVSKTLYLIHYQFLREQKGKKSNLNGIRGVYLILPNIDFTGVPVSLY